MLAAISGYVSNQYSRIPGQTAPEKATYVARQTLKTLPWIAAGATIYKLTPPSLHSTVQLGSMLAAASIPFPQLPTGLLLVYKSIEFKNHSINFLKATQVADRIALFARTYFALKFAVIYYSGLFTEKPYLTDSKPLNSNTTPFEIAVTTATIGGMLYYNPNPTLIGLTAGVLINMMKPSAEDLPYVENLVLLQDAKPTDAPLATAGKIAYIWDAWNIFARAIDTTFGAVYSGALQGRKLEWYYSALFSTLSGH